MVFLLWSESHLYLGSSKIFWITRLRWFLSRFVDRSHNMVLLDLLGLRFDLGFLTMGGSLSCHGFSQDSWLAHGVWLFSQIVALSHPLVLLMKQWISRILWFFSWNNESLEPFGLSLGFRITLRLRFFTHLMDISNWLGFLSGGESLLDCGFSPR